MYYYSFTAYLKNSEHCPLHMQLSTLCKTSYYSISYVKYNSLIACCKLCMNLHIHNSCSIDWSAGMQLLASLASPRAPRCNTETTVHPCRLDTIKSDQFDDSLWEDVKAELVHFHCKDILLQLMFLCHISEQAIQKPLRDCSSS